MNITLKLAPMPRRLRPGQIPAEDLEILRRVRDLYVRDPYRDIAYILHEKGWTEQRLADLVQSQLGQQTAPDPVWNKVQNAFRDILRGQ